MATEQHVQRQSESMADKVEVAALARVLEQEKQIKARTRKTRGKKCLYHSLE